MMLVWIYFAACSRGIPQRAVSGLRGVVSWGSTSAFEKKTKNYFKIHKTLKKQTKKKNFDLPKSFVGLGASTVEW
jgi:predicted nucleic acid-binding protein